METTDLPLWLVEESHKNASDWGETAALLLDTAGVGGGSISLSEVVRDRMAGESDVGWTVVIYDEKIYANWIADLEESDVDGRLVQGDFFAPAASPSWPVKLSPSLKCASWDEVKRIRNQGADGVLLMKDQQCWYWRPDPLTVKCGLLAAQAKDGIYSDYTFGVWEGDELVSIGKARGLTEEEIWEIDEFVRGNTEDNRGPARMVAAEQVFEISCRGVQRSKRHQSRLSLRDPQISRWLRDVVAADADNIEVLRAHLN